MEQKNLDRIEAYLMRTMTPEARKAFEVEMETDASLEEVVARHGRFVHGVQEHLLRETLAEIHQEKLGSINPIRRSFRFHPLWGVAATILILIGVYLIWPKSDATGLSALYPIELDPGLPTVLGETTSLEFGEGMNAYKLQDYPAARTYWTPLLDAQPQNDTLLFYLAQVDLAEENNTAAIEKLETIRTLTASVFLDKATWYLALGKLKTDQTDEAKALLIQISTSKSTWAPRAQALLEAMKTP